MKGSYKLLGIIVISLILRPDAALAYQAEHGFQLCEDFVIEHLPPLKSVFHIKDDGKVEITSTKDEYYDPADNTLTLTTPNRGFNGAYSENQFSYKFIYESGRLKYIKSNYSLVRGRGVEDGKVSVSFLISNNGQSCYPQHLDQREDTSKSLGDIHRATVGFDLFGCKKLGDFYKKHRVMRYCAYLSVNSNLTNSKNFNANKLTASDYYFSSENYLDLFPLDRDLYWTKPKQFSIKLEKFSKQVRQECADSRADESSIFKSFGGTSDGNGVLAEVPVSAGYENFKNMCASESAISAVEGYFRDYPDGIPQYPGDKSSDFSVTK